MKYTIYGKPGCIFCVKAKKLLDRHNLKYDYVDLEEDHQAMYFVREVLNARKVPQIMKNNDDGSAEYIGGYDDLKETF